MGGGGEEEGGGGGGGGGICFFGKYRTLVSLQHSLLQVMFASVNNLTGAEQLALADLLRNLLQTFKLPIEIIRLVGRGTSHGGPQ